MEYIGFIAATLTTASFLPQVYHTIRINDTKSISLTMYLLFFVGTICWFGYGLVLTAWPIIIANGITMTLAGIIFTIKLRNLITGKDSAST